MGNTHTQCMHILKVLSTFYLHTTFTMTWQLGNIQKHMYEGTRYAIHTQQPLEMTHICLHYTSCPILLKLVIKLLHYLPTTIPY